MVIVALVTFILWAYDFGMKMKYRRAEGLRIAYCYAVAEKGERYMIDHKQEEAKHRAVVVTKRTEAEATLNPELRKVMLDFAKDAEGRSNRYANLARPYQEKEAVYAGLRQLFEEASSRPWWPLPPRPSEWPVFE